MRHRHFMGYGYYGALILTILLIIVIIILLIFIINIRKDFNPYTKEILEILRERYIKDEINVEEYREIKMIIENEKNPDLNRLELMKKCAKGEISKEEYKNFK